MFITTFQRAYTLKRRWRAQVRILLITMETIKKAHFKIFWTRFLFIAIWFCGLGTQNNNCQHIWFYYIKVSKSDDNIQNDLLDVGQLKAPFSHSINMAGLSSHYWKWLSSTLHIFSLEISFQNERNLQISLSLERNSPIELNWLIQSPSHRIKNASKISNSNPWLTLNGPYSAEII